jgi:DNA helicase-2/ATP-dependent DNA helicase PcrA
MQAQAITRTLSEADFWTIVQDDLDVDPTELRPIVSAGSSTCMQINAGAGSGKTTALTLKILFALYVEDLPPRSILATTFTRKAAKELKSRIVQIGTRMLDAAAKRLPPELVEQLRAKDLNGVWAGTFDSLVQEILMEFKEARRPPPLPVEPFVAKGLLLRHGLFPQRRFDDVDLQDYLGRLRGRTYPPMNIREMVEVLYAIRTFAHTANVNVGAYLKNTQDRGALMAFQAIQEFEAKLAESHLSDYLGFANLFLAQAAKGTFEEFGRGLQLVVVDEYQDTNYLQERVYYVLARYVLQNKGAFVVVGDDDQSIHRFRGATVGLFRFFGARFEAAFVAEFPGARVRSESLVVNRRSTRRIVGFCQSFLDNDPAYRGGRIPKAALTPAESKPEGDPIYFLMRGGTDSQPLAQEVGRIMGAINAGGWRPRPQDQPINLHPEGTMGDVAIIAATVREERGDKVRLIGHLRQVLRGTPLRLFNPRGRPLGDVPEVAILLGLLLESFDPMSTQAPARLPQAVQVTLQNWRTQGRAFMGNHQTPSHVRPRRTLPQYVQGLSALRAPGKIRTVIVSEIIYRLATWIPFFQEDIEGLAYLELLQRCLSQSQPLGKWRGKIAYDDQGLIDASVAEIYWQFFVPLATGDLDVDEELLATLPKGLIPVLTIHQAKGLEYPMVIADVGSDFKTNHASQADSRFPATKPDQPNLFRQEFGRFAAYVDNSRSDVDERFDDLVRKYFVAFSRSAEVLMLVAHEEGIRRRVPNGATWWLRTGTWGPLMNHVQVLP